MELKSVYKQAKVGMIPEDWEVKYLKDIVSKVIDNRGKTPPYSVDQDIELIETVSISFVNQYPDYSKVTKFVSENDYNNWFRGHPLKHDILISTVGEYSGFSAILKENRGTIAQNIIALRIKKADPAFVFYWTRSNSFKKQLDKVMMNQAQPSLRVPWLLNFDLNIPPTKAEQEAIAEALSDTDALIESLEQLIVKKRQIKKGAMQKLLTGKKRLPGFKGEWKVKRLGDLLLASPDYGINAPATKPSGDLPTYLRITDIDDYGNFRNDDRMAVNHPASENYFLGANEIVFARTGASVGKTYLYKPSDGEMVFAGFLIRAKIDPSRLNPVFFFNFTATSDYWNWVRIMSMRSGQPGINGNEYASLEFSVPPSLEEQSAIATILSDIDAEIASLEEKLAKARKVKQGMMQELLTGRIRLI